jgi:uncharacterized delta-60 repeat protein
VRAIVAQPDLKLLVAGTYTNADRVMRSTVFRLQPDGGVDASLQLPFVDPTNLTIKTVGYHPDQHVVIGGSFYSVGPYRFSKLAWLGSDGRPESRLTPGTGGTGPTYGVGAGWLDWVMVQPDRKVLVGGSFEGVSDIVTVTNFPRTACARLNADGTVDQTFDLGAASGVSLRQAVCLADGSYLLFGSFTQLHGVAVTNLARALPDGSIDAAFRLPSAGDRIDAVLGLQADGRLLMQGRLTLDGGPARTGFALLNPDLTWDWGFTPDNQVSGFGMLQPDGRIVMAGSYRSSSSGLLVLANGPFRLMGGRGDPPVIEQDPQALDVAAGANAELRVTARGTGPLRYLWRFNPYSLYRRTESTLAWSQVTTADAGRYHVTVYNDYGLVDSRQATLNVVEVDVLPKKVTVRAGLSPLFQGSVWSLNPATYSWQKDGVTLDGATNLNLSLSNVRPEQQGRYTLTAEINGSRFTSPPAELIVTTPPSIVNQPAGQTVRAGSRAVFRVEATGTPPLLYRWRHGDHWHPDQDTPDLVLDGVRAGDAGEYYVEVVNLQGSALSDHAWLVVTPAPNFLPGTGGIEIGDGQLHLRLQDYDPAKPIEILESTDLRTWTVIHTFLQPTGVVEYSAPVASTGGARFYQARQ